MKWLATLALATGILSACGADDGADDPSSGTKSNDASLSFPVRTILASPTFSARASHFRGTPWRSGQAAKTASVPA